jgi:hypothetical protein
MIRARRVTLAALLTALAVPARAHHGVAAVSIAGPEGPGAANETTSPLPLPEGTLFAMAKSEYVSFRQYAGWPAPQKTHASFNLAALGYGVRPWLSVYLFQPLNAKSQDGAGTNVGLGDTNLMLALAFKWDEGLRLVPERESLDELEDWHFSTWIASTLPVGPTGARDRAGARFAPDLQTGFGAPSPSGGMAVLKQLSRDLTGLADASYQAFLPHTYPDGLRYRFGGETRLDAALVWRVPGTGRLRLDLCGELNGLHLQRDRARDPGQASLAALEASGGAILYGALGVRVAGGPTLALGAKRAIARRLNEAADQQGAEGLENLRAVVTLSWSTGLR